MSASFAGVPFYYVDDSLAGVMYNEQSVATGATKSSNNGNSNAIQNPATTEMQFTSQKAEQITVTGFVAGIQAKADLIKAFRQYITNSFFKCKFYKNY